MMSNKHRIFAFLILTAVCAALFCACAGEQGLTVSEMTASATNAQPGSSLDGKPSAANTDPAVLPTDSPSVSDTKPIVTPPASTTTAPITEPPATDSPTPTAPTIDPTTHTVLPPDDLNPGDIVNWCSHEHTHEIQDKDATCTTDGYKDRLQCSDCGAILDGTGKIIPAYRHSYSNRKCIYCSKNQPSLVVGGQFENSAVIWQLYDDGELAVSGEGEIPSFPEGENSYFFGYNKAIKSIVVYYGVTKIGDNAFRNLKEALTISISSSVRSIGDHSFDGWQLKTLNLSYGLTSVGKDNFTGNRLFFLELPGSLQSIGAGSFTSQNLVTLRVPASVTRFDAHENQYSNLRNVAFMGDEASAMNLDIYRHLRLDSACANVSILFKYTKNANKLAYCTKRGSASGDFSFNVYSDKTAIISAYRGKESNLVIPETLSSYTIVGIAHECFKNNSTVKSITLPATLTDIYNKAFIDSSLEELTILGDKVRVGEAAFSGCSSLKKLNFEGTFTEIGGKAFVHTKIESFPLDPSMAYARTSCFASSAVKNVNYGQFEVIGDSAFARTSVSDVDLTGVREVCGGAFYNVGLKTLNLTGVEIVGHAAFVGNSSLKASAVTGLGDVVQLDTGAFDFKV